MFDSTRDYVEQIDRYKEHQDKPTERADRVYARFPATCEVCGKAYETTNRAGAKYTVCGHTCREKLRYRQSIGVPVANSDMKMKRLSATCEVCGKPFQTTQRPHKYTACSESCSKKAAARAKG